MRVRVRYWVRVKVKVLYFPSECDQSLPIFVLFFSHAYTLAVTKVCSGFGDKVHQRMVNEMRTPKKQCQANFPRPS